MRPPSTLCNSSEVNSFRVSWLRVSFFSVFSMFSSPKHFVHISLQETVAGLIHASFHCGPSRGEQRPTSLKLTWHKDRCRAAPGIQDRFSSRHRYNNLQPLCLILLR